MAASKRVEMAVEPTFDALKQFESVKRSALSAIKNSFPVTGNKHKLILKDAWVDDKLDIHDIPSQKNARINNKTWSVPVFAALDLVDARTGELIDSTRRMRLMDLPKITPRSSYIVDGNEYQVTNQLRLRPGIYTRIKNNGELESKVNLAKGENFDILLNQERGVFILKRGTANIKLYPILRDLGVTDQQIRSAWGEDLLRSNAHSSRGVMDTEIKKLRSAFMRKPAPDRETAVQDVRQYLDETVIDEETTKITMGKAYTKADAKMLLDTSKRLLETARGQKPADDRDSMVFKSFHGVEDFIQERLRLNKESVLRRISRRIDGRAKIREILSKDTFNNPLKTLFTQTSLSNATEQINPLHMHGGHMKVTIMGDGGIQNEQAVSDAARMVHPTEVGFIDPILTPQSGQVGVVTRLATGAKKMGQRLYTRVYNAKTGAVESIDAITFENSVVAFPDQYRKLPSGKVSPRSKMVKVMSGKNNITTVPARKVQYVMVDPKTMFTISTNLVPFLNSTQGNRAMMASNQYEQAVALKYREQPLVQIDSGIMGQTAELQVGKALAHTSPVDGVVTKVEDEYVHLKDNSGKSHKIGLYRDFPLNQKTFLDAEVKVSVGDKLKKGDLVADNNYTKDGVLSMGTNLRVAYVPSKGYNFEDGIVISSTASKKLTSVHMHKEHVRIPEGAVLKKSRFMAYAPGVVKPANANKLDEDGVIKEGETVDYGDVVIAMLGKKPTNPEQAQMKRLHKALARPFSPMPSEWNYEFQGLVTKVVKTAKEVTVYIKTEEPATIGDKLSGRYGNKGIISRILPDSEMPHTKDGAAVEVMLNPIGIPSRLNPGQVLETAAAKVADKTGETFKIRNFSGENNFDLVSKLLKKNKVKDKEVLIDPEDGKPLGAPVMVGKQFLLKLDFPVRKKFSARSGGPGTKYTMDMHPGSEPGASGQTMDHLTMYSMLAHGARENLREMATYKAEKNDEFWRALQLGQPLPMPKPTFTFEKFINMLKGGGVNVEKKGNNFHLMPMTDSHVMEMSNGAIQNSSLLKGKNLQPEKGGLFDPDVTGGAKGSNWGHINLTEAIPNPVFEDAIKTLTGIKQSQFDEIMSGKAKVNSRGEIGDSGVTGGEAIKKLLARVDVKGRLNSLRASAVTAKSSQLNTMNKEIRYLKALDENGMKPTDYVISKVPVIPPKFRPIYPMPDGSLNTPDVNLMYRDLGLVNEQLKLNAKLPDSEKQDLRRDLYKSMKALSGLGNPITYKKYKGFIEQIKGKVPKKGYFQRKLVSRRQDLTGRSTIIPEPTLGVDQVGLPKKMAWEIYKPHIIRELVQRGYTPLSAQEQVSKKTPIAQQALDAAVSKRPVMLNRSPSLHKFSIMAFNPVLTAGKTIKIHPLVVKGFGADFDGDTMAVHVPASEKARIESFKLLPTNNIFDPSTGDVMLAPQNEMVLGLYLLTKAGKSTRKKFRTLDQAISEMKAGKITINAIANIAGSKTTIGRAMVNAVLPAKFKDPNIFLNNKNLNELLKKVAKEDKSSFGRVVDALKDLGNQHSFKTGFTVGMEDIAPKTEARSKALLAAQKAITGKANDQKIVSAYSEAGKLLDKLVVQEGQKRDTALFHMLNSGAKGSPLQMRQITAAPMLVQDHIGNVIPQPITKSYSEGLDTAGYWSAMYGARAGSIGKSLQSAVPGYFGKRLVSSVMSNTITVDDCGTNNGIELPVGSRDVLGRFLASGNPSTVGRKNDLVDSVVVSKARKSRVAAIKVRSPHTCEASNGTCAKCFGHSEDGNTLKIGDNLGVLAATSLSEPLLNMSMKAFHTGGVAGAGAGVAAIAQGYDRLAQILELPDIVKGKATLASRGGKITSIEINPAGGHFVYVENERHFVPQGRVLKVKKGQLVEKGDYLSDGVAKPQELIELKGVDYTREYMADELQKAYSKPIKRNFFEAVVKEITNVTRINDPGKNKDFEVGDYVPLNVVQEKNKAGEGIQHTPTLKGINTLPLVSEDWMARLGTRDLAKTIRDGASKGWTSDIHGTHPIPGYVYGAEFGQGTEGKY
jgi:DNA-directed RNA polymerase subunit beta'